MRTWTDDRLGSLLHTGRDRRHHPTALDLQLPRAGSSARPRLALCRKMVWLVTWVLSRAPHCEGKHAKSPHHQSTTVDNEAPHNAKRAATHCHCCRTLVAGMFGGVASSLLSSVVPAAFPSSALAFVIASEVCAGLYSAGGLLLLLLLFLPLPRWAFYLSVCLDRFVSLKSPVPKKGEIMYSSILYNLATPQHFQRAASCSRAMRLLGVLCSSMLAQLLLMQGYQKVRRPFNQSISPSLSHSLTHHSLTHSSLTHSPFPLSLPHSLTLTHSLAHSLTLTHSPFLTHSLILTHNQMVLFYITCAALFVALVLSIVLPFRRLDDVQVRGSLRLRAVCRAKARF